MLLMAFVLIAIGAGISGGWNHFTRNMALFSMGYAVALGAMALEEIEERNK
jgi:hypothetical protein